MNKKTIIIIVSVLLVTLVLPKLFINFLEWNSFKDSVKANIENIEAEFRGIVIDKYSFRKNAPETHLKIQTNDSIFQISPFGDVVRKSSIGDSIIKLKSENEVFIKRNDSIIYEHYYIRIPKRNRESNKFPSEWKNKWMESSGYDTLNRK